MSPFLFGPPETLDDGQLAVYIVRAQTVGDYVRLIWGGLGVLVAPYL